MLLPNRRRQCTRAIRGLRHVHPRTRLSPPWPPWPVWGTTSGRD